MQYELSDFPKDWRCGIELHSGERWTGTVQWTGVTKENRLVVHIKTAEGQDKVIRLNQISNVEGL